MPATEGLKSHVFLSKNKIKKYTKKIKHKSNFVHSPVLSLNNNLWWAKTTDIINTVAAASIFAALGNSTCLNVHFFV